MLVQPSLYCCSILILFNLKNLRHHQSYIFLFTDLIPARRRRSTSNSFKGHTALAMQLSKILRQKQKDDHRVQKFLSQTKPSSESEPKNWQKCDRKSFWSWSFVSDTDEVCQDGSGKPARPSTGESCQGWQGGALEISLESRQIKIL